MTGDISPGTSAGPADRVRTSLPDLVAHVATEYRLGGVVDWSVFATGYEDCNIDLRTRQARLVVKVFAADRPAGIAVRTAGVIEAVRKAKGPAPEAKKEEPKPEAKKEEAKPAEAKKEEPKKEEPKPAEVKKEEPKKEEAKPAEAKKEEPKKN